MKRNSPDVQVCTDGATNTVTLEFRYMDLDDLFRLACQRTLPPPDERRRIRVTAGITQDELATVLGVSRAAVARWESGNRHPRSDMHATYATAHS